jgi:PAS domain S-box-containing protein
MTKACRAAPGGGRVWHPHIPPTARCPTDSPDVEKTTKKMLLEALHESQRRQAEVAALLKGARAVLKHRDFRNAARSIFDSCKELIGATSGYVALLDKDETENQVLFLDSGGLPCAVDPDLPMPIRGLREKAYRTGKVTYCNHFCRSRWVRFLPEGHVALDNVLFAPLVIEGKPRGLLGLANKPSGFSGHDARMASALGELAAVALQNSRALESLEHSEERFRSLTQSASDAIVSADSSGNIVHWNRAAERMFGYPAGAMIGKPLSLIMPEQVRPAHQNAIRCVTSASDSRIIGKTIEVTGLRSDGCEFPIELSLSTWGTGEQRFFSGILRDITERKQAEKTRQKLTQDLAKRVKELNCLYGLSKLAETPDITLDELFRRVAELIPPARQSPELTCARIVFEGREYASDNFRATGCQQSTDIRVQGKRSGCVEVYGPRDVPECDAAACQQEERSLLEAVAERLGRIVERRRVEEALQKTKRSLKIQIQQRTAELRNKEESLAEAQRIAHLGNWDWDISTNQLRWSDEVCRIFGLGPRQFAATYDAFLGSVHTDDRARVEEAVKRALEKPGAGYGIDHRVIRPDGSERIVQERGEVMFDRQGRPRRMIGTVHDVTERKKLEREILNVTTDEQRRMGQELHDGLGQELTGLSYLAASLCQKLQSKGLPEAEAAADLAKGIPEVLRQLKTIVKGLLPLEMDAGALVPALQGLAASVEEGTTVSCRFESSRHVRVHDDYTAIQLYRIAQEAVRNALKHGQPKCVTLALSSHQRQIRLEVGDDGVGIGSDVEKTSGSGLRIMGYRASVIGGTLDVRQQTGGGTLVTCIVPRGEAR